MADWHCAAYGPEGVAVGARCFVAPALDQRVCGTEGECADVLRRERRRVYGRISELAAAGDPVAEYLEAEFASPDQLLGGGAE